MEKNIINPSSPVESISLHWPIRKGNSTYIGTRKLLLELLEDISDEILFCFNFSVCAYEAFQIIEIILDRLAWNGTCQTTQ